MKCFVILLLACVLSACAAAGSKSSQAKGPFVVTGYGKTEELAKQDAFKKAVEFAIGVGIQTERITSDNKVGRNYVLAHSSGYIDSFRVIDITKDSNSVEIVMEVYVRSTVTDDYVLKSAKVEQKLDGNFVKEQVNTYMTERTNGDKLLDSILKDYPEKAYTVVTSKGHQFQMDQDRRFYVKIQYNVKFSDEYLKSLAQLLDQTKDVECTFKCGSYPSVKVIYKKQPNDYLSTSETYYFRDIYRPEKVYKHLTGQNFGTVYNPEQKSYYDARYMLKFDFLDFSKNVLNTVCVFSESAKVRKNLGSRHEYIITNQIIADETVEIPISYNGRPTKLNQNIDKLDYIKLSVVRPESCVEK